jgi:hypothetical protein
VHAFAKYLLILIVGLILLLTFVLNSINSTVCVQNETGGVIKLSIDVCKDKTDLETVDPGSCLCFPFAICSESSYKIDIAHDGRMESAELGYFNSTEAVLEKVTWWYHSLRGKNVNRVDMVTIRELELNLDDKQSVSSSLSVSYNDNYSGLLVCKSLPRPDP